MKLMCKSVETGSDVSCPVCGQGFLLYWTRRSPQDQPVLLSVVMDALGRQHMACSGVEAHNADQALSEVGFASSAAAPLQEAQWGYC